MTKLWEDTVVTALRDAQWINCKGKSPKAVAPSGFLKLDGNAESALGDVIYSANSRYYIIEVKSSSADISSEWTGGSAKGSPQKKVYSNLAARWHELEEAVDDLGSGRNVEDIRKEIFKHTNFIQKSVSCHLFAYWEHWTVDDADVGQVVITPYLSGCLRNIDPKKFNGSPYINRHFDSDFLMGRNVGGDSYVAEVAALGLMFEDGARVFAVNTNGGENVSWSALLGLKLKDFQDYINELVGYSGDDVPEMHGIMMSDSGQVFEFFSSLSELKLALNFVVAANKLKPASRKFRRAPSGKASLLGLRSTKP